MDNVKSMEAGSTRMQAMMSDRRVTTEISSDISLPDYQPPIKRLLCVRATVTSVDKYVGSGESELFGTVEYSILYSDDAGELYCSVQHGEYRFTVPMESTHDFDLGDGLICDAEIVAEAPSGRVLAPRRLSLKCRLRSRVRFYGTRLQGEHAGGVGEGSIQRLHKSAEYAECFVGSSEPIVLSDEILSDVEKGPIRVICADAMILVNEASCGSGCVNCRGEVVLKLLCVHEDGGSMPFTQIRRLPFSGTVPTDGAEVNCFATARGVATDVGVTVEEDRILCDVSVRLEARAGRNRTLTYTSDVYSTDAEGGCSVQTVHLPMALRSHMGNFSLNTTLSLEEAGIRRDAEIADVFLTPCIGDLENENGRYVLVGRCRCCVLLCGEGDASVQEFELPFRYVTEGSSDTVIDYDAEVLPISCRVRADGERIHVDAELSVTLLTRGGQDVQMVTEETFATPLEQRNAAYLICYPSREDTLWSVAKRYHRSVEEIARINPLAEGPSADAADSLAGVRYLLV